VLGILSLLSITLHLFASQWTFSSHYLLIFSNQISTTTISMVIVGESIFGVHAEVLDYAPLLLVPSWLSAAVRLSFHPSV
jgi:hypothetical protein